jgi:CRISPR/Cas system-associated protein Cas5 (RAMP superfamily)
MKTYIVYGKDGEELGYIKAGSHNSAEKKAIRKWGVFISVIYTEL